MSNELVVYQAPSQAQIDILRNTLCKDLSPGEMQLFLAVCQRRQLDPFANEVHAVMRKSKNKDGSYTPKLTIITGVDGFRSQAERSGQYDGQDEPEYDCLPDGKTKNPLWARVSVYRRDADRRIKTTFRAFWSEFAEDEFQWKRRPWHMLGIRAETHALRKAFPRQLAGLYEASERFHDDEPGQAAPLGAAAVQQVLEAPPMAPELLTKWNRAIAAFAGLGIDVEQMLERVHIATPAELTVAHLAELSNWYETLNKPRE